MKLSRRSFREVGKFQWCVLFLFTIGGLPGIWGNAGVLFMAPKLVHWCGSNFTSFEAMNVSERKLLTSQWPKCQKPDSEYWLDPDHNLSTLTVNWTQCSEVEFEKGVVFEWTVTQKYNLSCGREWLISFGNTVYMCGFFISAVTCGALADRFGRKTVVIVSNVLAIAGNLLVALAPTLEVYYLGRSLMASGEMGSYTSAYILVMELLRKDQRIMASAFGGPLGLVIGCSLPGVATVLPNHEHFSYLLAGIVFVILIFNWFTFPESPRWLTSRKRFKESEKVVEWISAFNHVDKSELAYLFQADEEERFHISPLDLFRTPLIRKRTLILWTLWLSTILTNYGLLYNLADFGTDVRVSLVLMSVLEFPAWALVAWMTEKFGRQSSLFMSMLVSGLCCLCMAPLVEDKSSALLSALALLGKTFVGNQFFLVYQFTPELYPTVIRTMGLGASSTVARIAGMVAPLISLLNAYWPPMLVVLLGLVTVLTAILVPYLPDTTGHELAQTIDEGESFLAEHGYRLVLPPDFRCSSKAKAKAKPKVTDPEDTVEMQETAGDR